MEQTNLRWETTYEIEETMPDGRPVPRGHKWPMPSKIAWLASWGKDAREAEQKIRDVGWELYEQHELNGGREPVRTYCEHEPIDVADGPRNRITTGHTLVWSFCSDCGEECGGGEPTQFYWVWKIRYEVRTLWNGYEIVDTRKKQVKKWKEGPMYGLDVENISTFDDAEPSIREAAKARISKAEAHDAQFGVCDECEHFYEDCTCYDE